MTAQSAGRPASWSPAMTAAWSPSSALPGELQQRVRAAVDQHGLADRQRGDRAATAAGPRWPPAKISTAG